MRYLIKKKDGTVSIMTTVRDDVDPNEEIKKWSSESREKVESCRILSDSELPQDRYFRNAWRHSDNEVCVDIEKCKDIHKDHIRGLRKPKLEALDVDFYRALESNDEEEKNRIINKKQILRDITKHDELLNANTPEEVKSFMPDILK